jgi:hypothetical protein
LEELNPTEFAITMHSQDRLLMESFKNMNSDEKKEAYEIGLDFMKQVFS